MQFRIPFSGRAHRYTQTEIDTVLTAMQQADPLTQGRYREEFEKKSATTSACHTVSP